MVARPLNPLYCSFFRAVELGINYVDNNIAAECDLYGESMAKSAAAQRDKWFIGFASWPQKITTEYEQNLTREGTLKSIDDRLRSYRTDVLDMWRPVGATWGEGQTNISTMLMVSQKTLDLVVEVFETAKQQGKVRFLGISAHNPQVFRRVHLAANVSRIKCHGLSAPHANDEDVGATPPDIVFKREGVDAMWRECHEEHDVPADQVHDSSIAACRSVPRPYAPTATAPTRSNRRRRRGSFPGRARRQEGSFLRAGITAKLCQNILTGKTASTAAERHGYPSWAVGRRPFVHRPALRQRITAPCFGGFSASPGNGRAVEHAMGSR